jgi:sporulation protein YtfJ
MVDVNTIVGTPITTPDGVTLIPVSKVTFGFTAGGSEFAPKSKAPGDKNAFAGGSGAGISITPVAFLVVHGESAKVLSVNPPPGTSTDRIIESVPELIDKISGLIKSRKKDKDDSDFRT